MFITRVISSAFDSVKRRITKVRIFGIGDVQTGFEASPYGTDSNPIANMRAIYASTSEKGKNVIIGYINVNQLAAVGEHRIYSTDENGELKFYIWLKNDGTCQFGGSVDNLVRYSPLNEGAQDLVAQLQGELVKIAAGIATGGGSYSPATLSLDITDYKIDEMKTL